MTTISLQPSAHLRRPTPATALRLTRRGQAVVVVSALLIAFVVGVFVSAAGSMATERSGSPAPTKIVQVHEGDTLWQIAAALGTDDDVRSTMSSIEDLNALSGPEIHVGQRLVVPAN